jgi:RNA polymerase sigma-70 factor (ECF subfamily)
VRQILAKPIHPQDLIARLRVWMNTLGTPAAMNSEAHAIEGAKRGDGDSFALLYALHKRRVYSLCLRMLGNVEAAEDSTQEAFLQLYRKIAGFRGESAFYSWMHRLTVNVVLMGHRRKTLTEVPLDEPASPFAEDGPTKEYGSDDLALITSIDRIHLQRAIDSLPPGYRMFVVLHDIEGYEYHEIADLMGCSIGNSKSQVHKGRMRLRHLLRQVQPVNLA